MGLSCTRSTLRWMMAVAIIAGLIGTGYYLVLYPFVAHQRWYRAVEYRIMCLAEKRPDEVDPKQWAACVHWTWQLHSNYGHISYWNAQARYPFLAEFDKRLKGKVDLSTINWIWDQYYLHTSCGTGYSDNYRPTTAERLKEASLDRYGENKLDQWFEMLRRRRSGEE